ncbi:MAG: CBS domain-containing protein [Chloroflexi bacterium]|nr:CBS domain-containing protein [Chloroflexota bacterium]
MLVKDCMTRHPIMISASTKAAEAQKILAENKVRHLPVAGDGKRLEGLVTRTRLSLKPDVLGSLNMWEITRQLSSLTAKDIMLRRKEVITIHEDRTVERAAKMMADSKIGCLPVVDANDVIVGIISEVDVLHSFEEMLGLPVDGLRITVRMPNKSGEFAKLMQALGQQGWGVMGIGTYPCRRREGFYDAVIKIPNASAEKVREVLGQIESQEVIDIRDVV